ncbi:DUF6492 family protein [Catellatospora sichuanensis]|uniref:DUF6492 family protein n=1 Tax=Catellatospora sichuanensis TaxID=1969805 RepID=UPI0016423768|nr:DUF6492 family protein [Catellatospora sichuanensis]
MPRLAIVTPSYAPDAELCADLVRSVLVHGSASVQHHIIVPPRDLKLFAHLRDSRVQIHPTSDFLPGSVLPVPGTNLNVNLRRPWPPIRGWVLQQITKLAAASHFDADVVLLVDSDTEFVRPFGPETYLQDGVVRFYRLPHAVDNQLPRHVLWHHAARRLLGLPPAEPPFHDYVNMPCAWSPALVRAMQRRIGEVTGRPWQSAVGGQLHVSEMMLYGVFVDHLADESARGFTRSDMMCRNHYDEVPLTENELRSFSDDLADGDIAVMVSAKSGTPRSVRRSVLDTLAQRSD